MPDHNATHTSHTAQTSAPSWMSLGFIAFAGAMMMMLGIFHVMAGLVALFEEDYFLVTRGGLVIDVDYTVWGWTHLIIGLVVAFAGAGLFSGKTWARVVAVVLAMLSAMANMAFLSAYPIWAAIMIAVDILVIYAVLVHGDKDSLVSPQPSD